MTTLAHSPLPLDLERSRSLANLVQAAPKQCWRNAVLALMYLPATAVYVEGWAVTAQNIAVEHGWLENAGCILDPTYGLAGDTEAAATRYFAGVRYASEDALDRVARRETLPLIYTRENPFGLKHPDYAAAYSAALACALAAQA